MNTLEKKEKGGGVNARPATFVRRGVEAIQRGDKWQTRRVIEQQFHRLVHQPAECKHPSWAITHGPSLHHGVVADEQGNQNRIVCPYGKPGDRLWVREEHYRFGHWEPVPGVRTKTGRQKWRFVADTEEVLYDAPPVLKCSISHVPGWRKRLARFMPKVCSRIILEVVSVRVERLQEISEEDAKAEGGKPLSLADGGFVPLSGTDWIGGFRKLWESIHGPGSWELNPWVWVVEFRKLTGVA